MSYTCTFNIIDNPKDLMLQTLRSFTVVCLTFMDLKWVERDAPYPISCNSCFSYPLFQFVSRRALYASACTMGVCRLITQECDVVENEHPILLYYLFPLNDFDAHTVWKLNSPSPSLGSKIHKSVMVILVVIVARCNRGNGTILVCNIVIHWDFFNDVLYLEANSGLLSG